MSAIFRGAVWATILNAACLAPAVAAEEGSSSWKFRVAPYIWATSISGDQGVGTLPTADLDISFSDLFDHIDFALMGRAEAERGPWTFYADTFFSTIGATQSSDVTFGPFSLGPVTVGPFQVGRHQIGPFTFSPTVGPFTETVGLSLNLHMDIIEMGTRYRLGEWPLSGDKRRWSLSLLGGGRYTYVDVKLGASVGGQSTEGEMDEDWIDPFVGARVDLDLTPKWQLMARGDVGGFGVGSDFTWNAIGGVSYHWRPGTSLFAGYRALYQNYETGSGQDHFLWDLTLHGPVVSLQFSW